MGAMGTICERAWLWAVQRLGEAIANPPDCFNAALVNSPDKLLAKFANLNINYLQRWVGIGRVVAGILDGLPANNLAGALMEQVEYGGMAPFEP